MATTSNMARLETKWIPSLSARVMPALAVLVLGPALVLVPAAAMAQDPGSTFEGTTDVVQVEVPINVVTRDGQPVTGLTEESFAVYDEGKLQKLVGFEVIDLGELGGEQAEARIEDMPSVARRNILLFFDFSFSTPPSIVKARVAAHDFVLNALHPSDLVAIATFSLEFGPRLLVTFTPDRAQLARAIDTLGLTRRPGSMQDPLLFMLDPPQGSITGQGDITGGGEVQAQLENVALESLRVIAKQMERNEKNYLTSRVTAWSRALADVAKSLNSVAGRKHVVYFSEGFDSELLLGRRPTTTVGDFDLRMQDRTTGQLWMVNADEEHGSTFLQGDLEDMLEEFRRADCVIQAIDIAGLRADLDSDNGRGKGADGLFFIANETGGQLFEASNNLTAQLGQVLKRTEVTYVLSFQPENVEPDGRYHKLKVEVEGVRGSRVSYRAGYYAPRPFAALHPLEKSLLASDAIASAEPRQDVEMDVLAAPFRASAEMAYVPVIVEVQGESLLVDQASDDLDVEVYAYVTNQKGEMLDYFSHRAEVNLKGVQGKLLDAGIKFYGHLEMGPGDYLLRVLVRNGETGRTGVVATPIAVPRYDVAETTLLPPFFMDDPINKWLLLRHRSDEEVGSVVYPFTLKGVPFVPAVKPALKAGKPVELCLMTYNLGAGEPAIEAWVVGSDGEEKAANGNLALVERTVTGISGFDKLLANFNPKGLKRGEYTLKVALTDPATGSQQLNSIPFFVN